MKREEIRKRFRPAAGRGFYWGMITERLKYAMVSAENRWEANLKQLGTEYLRWKENTDST